MNIILLVSPENGSLQDKFETSAVAFGLNIGMFSINGDGSCYLNVNIQELWVKFQKNL